MPHLTVGTINDSPGTARVLQYVGTKWNDLTYNFGEISPYNDAITALTYYKNYLFASSTETGIVYYDKAKKEWKIPPWNNDGNGGDGSYATFQQYDGHLFVVGSQVSRISEPLQATVTLTNTGGMENVASIISDLSGQPEIVLTYGWNDSFRSFSLPSGATAFSDSQSGCCGYDLYEYQNVIYSANDYGWVYKSTDGHSFGPHYEDLNDGGFSGGSFGGRPPVTAPNRHDIWSLFEVSGQLYFGTCALDAPGNCHIGRFNGSLFTTSPVVVSVSTQVYGQGFVRALQSPDRPGIAYVASGLTYYDLNNDVDESKCYTFDGAALIDISPPAPDPNFPTRRFDFGIASMCFAPNLVRGKAAVGTVSSSLLVSDRATVKAGKGPSVAMPSTRTASGSAAALQVGRVMLQSDDATTWTIVPTPYDTSNGDWIGNTIRYGSNQWVMGASGDGVGCLATSADGLVWSTRPNVFDATATGSGGGDPTFVAWSPTRSLWVAGAGTPDTDLIQTSPDGVTWTPRAIPFDGGVKLDYSATGSPFGQSGVVQCGAWGGDKYVVGGMRSTANIGTAVEWPLPSEYPNVSWSRNADGSISGTTNYVATLTLTQPSHLAMSVTSEPGSTGTVSIYHKPPGWNFFNGYPVWAHSSAQVSDESWRGNGSFTTPLLKAGTYAVHVRNTQYANPLVVLTIGKYAIHTHTGSCIATSSNGLTWTDRSNPFSAGVGPSIVPWNGDVRETGNLTGHGWVADVAYNGSMWVAVGRSWDGNYAIMTSPDGITWTGRGSILPGDPAGYHGGYGVAWSPSLSRWVAVGEDIIVTSTNGVTWTDVGHPSGDYRAIAWNSTINRFVVVGFANLEGVGYASRIMTSSNGTTWTVQPHPFDHAGGYLYDIAVGPGGTMRAVGFRAVGVDT